MINTKISGKHSNRKHDINILYLCDLVKVTMSKGLLTLSWGYFVHKVFFVTITASLLESLFSLLSLFLISLLYLFLLFWNNVQPPLLFLFSHFPLSTTHLSASLFLILSGSVVLKLFSMF